MSVPLHPALIHLPLGIAFVLPLVAAGLSWAIFHSFFPRRAWSVLLALALMAFATGLSAARAGEDEAQRLERRVPKAVIEAHEEAAERFVLALGVVFFAAAGAFAFRKPRAFTWATAAVAALSVGAAGLGVLAGHAGGELVYVHDAAHVRAIAAPAATRAPPPNVDP